MNCEWCDEPVLPREQHPAFPEQAMHIECGVRSVVGSVGHLLRRCSCRPTRWRHEALEDPPNLSKRDAARAAVNLMTQMVNWFGPKVDLS